MPTFRISGHFTVGGLDVPPGPKREARVTQVEAILREGLSQCSTINGFFVGRQMRPWTDKRHDGLPEPDIAEEVTICGEDREAVFATYRNDPAHLNMIAQLKALGCATWQVVVYQID